MKSQKGSADGSNARSRRPHCRVGGWLKPPHARGAVAMTSRRRRNWAVTPTVSPVYLSNRRLLGEKPRHPCSGLVRPSPAPATHGYRVATSQTRSGVGVHVSEPLQPSSHGGGDRQKAVV